MVPTVTGLIELVMRVGAAMVLGAAWGYEGVVWGNPLAWIGAVAGLVPAWVMAHRSLARMPIAPLSQVAATPEPITLEGPSGGVGAVDAVVPLATAADDVASPATATDVMADAVTADAGQPELCDHRGR